MNKDYTINSLRDFKKAKEEEGKEPCTLEQLREFFQDGVEILDFVKKRRADYFGKRGYKLIGCEVPIDVDLKKNVKMVGYLDLVILDEITNTLKIYDIKTSTQGWNKWMKKDENKTQQLLLYKQFYSKQYNHPVEEHRSRILHCKEKTMGKRSVSTKKSTEVLTREWYCKYEQGS